MPEQLWHTGCRADCSECDKEGGVILSSMHKHLLAAVILLGSASAAAGLNESPSRTSSFDLASLLPMALQAGTGNAASSGIAASVARWRSLRQSDSLPFESYAGFLLGHRGWPGESAMRRTAERRIGPDTPPSEVNRYFRSFPPLTPTGHAAHALALLALGQLDAARSAAREAWISGSLALLEEQRLAAAFGGTLNVSDHDRRIERLLADGDSAGARRILSLASPSRRTVFDVRLALQARAPDAAARLAALGPEHAGDPGLLIDRVRWLRNTGNSLAARQLLAQARIQGAPPENPARFMETLVGMARAAANDRQWSLAFDIARQVAAIYPAGADISRRSYAERDEYTNLAWLAGSTALDRLGRPAEAMRMFELYGRAAQSQQTRAKGFYWAARAARRAGQAERATAFLELAAAGPDQFYGQLAL